MSNTDMSLELLKLLGGIENIEKMSACKTRIRVEVCDKEKVDQDSIKHIYGVRGLVPFGNQIQIVLGEETEKIADVFFNKMKIHNSTK